MREPMNCPEHGEYDGFRYRRECPECEREAEKAIRRHDVAWSHYRWWDRSSGVPKRYQNRTVENWSPDGEHEDVVRIVRGYAATVSDRIGAGDGLTFLGPPGRGKTHLLTGLVSKVCGMGIRAMYASWPDLIETHRASIKAPSDDPSRQALENVTTAPFLALDELGIGSGSAWERAALFELIDYRYREALPTCCASNATASGLAEVIGERLADRLREMNVTAVLRGDSRRGAVQISDGPALDRPASEITVRLCFEEQMTERTIDRWKGYA